MSEEQESPEQRSWHHLEPEDVLKTLETPEEGLAEDEVERRREVHGSNRLPSPRTRGPLRRFLAQFHNLLIYVLMGAALVTALLGHWVDTGVILAVVLLNSIIGFVQEGKAEKALDAIRDMLSPHASVRRAGHRSTVPAEELVPGDLVLIEPGDKVPADLRLIKVKGLQVQEAVLTGESVAVDKGVDPVESEAELGDRLSMAFSGTLVTAGQATGVVVETGARTQIGRISGMLSEVQTLTTPLIKAMNTFARWLTLAIVMLAAMVFSFGLLVRDYSAVEMFMAAVALAVAAIPEGLPAILTVTLAIGVQLMASRNAIIRRLPAVETLGSVSIICSDKTGTLTRNEMTVRSLALAGGFYEVTGVGYDPHGAFERDGAEVDPDDDAALGEVIRAMVLCNDSSLYKRDDQWVVEGDPMEGALLTAGMKAGLNMEQLNKHWPRTDVVPFESEHRFMATLNHDHDGNGMIYVKGAPEQILEMCSRVSGEESLDKDHWLAKVDELANRGERILAVARRKSDNGQREIKFDELGSEFEFLGLFGLIDPPREEAITSVAECQQAGIRVKMITGDHAGTAQAIARQLGLAHADEVLTGRDIDSMDDEALREAVPRVDVFARAAPEHKLRLVRALQWHGYVVAMTGDGVNDAPALKQADVGVAMGRNGTETAKEASEMVLADDNFASIAHAVREGRRVYDNLKKAITFLLPINGGESGSIIAAIMLGMALPITPLQVLWVNMVSSVGLAMALAFEPAEKDVMSRPPRKPGEPILSLFLVWRILFVSVLFLAGIFGMYLWSIQAGYSIDAARTHAVNTLVIMEVFYLLSVRSLKVRSLTLKGLIGTRAVAIAILVVVTLQMIFTYAPFMQFFFDSTAVGLYAWGIMLGVGVVLFIILELEKAVRSRIAQSRS
ncbi:cation-transporting P-type ATPase [Ectothiorhodospira variabilis]|uniref:cation-transporting P-type ATPase n=1 Tax=Ectothiorhodospira variabilis TaxID=505694 RepID=UPI001EFAE667|nr:cation-transporting P-type ATPase [Ectothiorhodospira variabilis]MCG5494511.1 cation-transporting P-type ATPase [Ectothiorhodospira variabilis]MCG5503118.1 cation-transporting P-type ATPase [Ectothiorhodospira variabilis]MCG5506123.1 cation-transporting P-type ATPase [Ectothiorhodospira variabilis]